MLTLIIACNLEVYCVKKAHLSGQQTVYDMSDPAAVLRITAHVIPSGRDANHVVVMDHFYTSVALAVELMSRKLCSVGTIHF